MVVRTRVQFGRKTNLVNPFLGGQDVDGVGSLPRDDLSDVLCPVCGYEVSRRHIIECRRRGGDLYPDGAYMVLYVTKRKNTI